MPAFKNKETSHFQKRSKTKPCISLFLQMGKVCACASPTFPADLGGEEGGAGGCLPWPRGAPFTFLAWGVCLSLHLLSGDGPVKSAFRVGRRTGRRQLLALNLDSLTWSGGDHWKHLLKQDASPLPHPQHGGGGGAGEWGVGLITFQASFIWVRRQGSFRRKRLSVPYLWQVDSKVHVMMS